MKRFMRTGSTPLSRTVELRVNPPLAAFPVVTDGIHAALALPTDAANGLDVRLGGGPSTIQQYLKERPIDEMHIAIAPVLLGSGEGLFSGFDVVALGYECVEHVATENATHVVLRKA
jgi:dihydrofolate reductase